MAVEEDVGIVVDDDGEIQCRNHPYKNNKINPGGICAFCLQDKLGKLVSSSFPISVFPSSEEPISMNPIQTITSSSRHPCRIPFPITQQKQKQQQNKNKNTTSVSVSVSATVAAAGFDYKRSKSVNHDADSEIKKGFWSFLYHSKHRNHYKRKLDTKPCYEITQQQQGSKVCRSRSLGCGGSRSFSGDLLERISSGFGDCTLRRIELQSQERVVVGKEVGIGHDYCIKEKERVKCGGIGKNRSWEWGSWTLPSPIAYLSSSSSSSTSTSNSSYSSSAKRSGTGTAHESNNYKINLNNVTPSLMAAVTG